MRRIAVTGPARDDLLAIQDYLADHAGLRVADRVLADIRSDLDRLARHPGLGHHREALAPKALRFSLVHSYLLVYRHDAASLTLLRVLHASRDTRRALSLEP